MGSAGILRHSGQLIGTGAGSQWSRYSASPHSRKKYERVGYGRIPKDRYRLPALQPFFQQPSSDTLYLLAELRPGDLGIIVPNGDFFAQLSGIVGDDLRIAAKWFGKLGGDLCISHTRTLIADRASV